MSGESLYFIMRAVFTVALLATLVLIIRAALKDISAASPDRSIGSLEPRSILVVINAADAPIRTGSQLTLRSYAMIGRLPKADVFLDDPSVSGEHAEIRFVAPIWMLRDLGSRNGTVVNGQDVNQDVRLASGDLIAFGRVETRFVC